MANQEIIFTVEEAPEGGYTARALSGILLEIAAYPEISKEASKRCFASWSAATADSSKTPIFLAVLPCFAEPACPCKPFSMMTPME
jgi:hypothetical protein